MSAPLFRYREDEDEDKDTATVSRRVMLERCGMGFGMVGVAGVLADMGLLGAPETAPERGANRRATDIHPLAPRAPHFPARATRVVHLFMNGGPSQIDTFDPKPLLDKYHGKALPFTNFRTERKTGAAMRSPFEFRRSGQSDIPVSELFQKTAAHVDDMSIIRSMHGDVPNHEPALLLMNCGMTNQTRPSLGSWVTYGLGSVNQNLPGYIVLSAGALPVEGQRNWRSAFLPGAYQGTHLDTSHTEVHELVENIRNTSFSRPQQRKQLDLVRKLNEKHLARRQGDPGLEARIQSFELAFRMQLEASDAFDIHREPQSTHELYGSGLHARQLIITRRLLERGVRFVQVWSGDSQPWDHHDNLVPGIRTQCGAWDQPISGFLTDLKQRGLFDSTLVIWGGEFGRTPTAELPALSGRDHNHYGFTMWMAGGGVRGGYVHGATDEFGFAAVEKKVHVHDLHATILHLLGFDHEKLTYFYGGRDHRLTDVHGSVVRELIA